MFRDLTDVQIGAAIRHLREEKGWQAKQLAVVVGSNSSNLSRYESGKRSVCLNDAIKIVRVLGITMEDFAAIAARM